MLAILLAAALLQADAEPPVYNPELFIFVTVERMVVSEGPVRVRVGTYSGVMSRPDVTYWFFRENMNGEGRILGQARASSATCPQAVPVLRGLEDMTMPTPNVPGYKSYYNFLPLKDVSYRVSGILRHPDGQPGKYSIESKKGSPLPLWTDALLEALERCWGAASDARGSRG